MPPWSIGYHPNEFNWIYSHFEQYFLPGQIRPVEFEIRPGMKYCLKWVEIHGFTPNSTGHEILLKLG